MNTINMLGAQVGATQIVLWVVLGLMLVALLVYPMITRRRQARDFNEMLNNLSVGDKVMTNIGMIGTIKKINKKEDGATFQLETGDKTILEFDVGAIARVLSSVKPINYSNNKPNNVNDETKTEEAIKNDIALEKERKKEDKNAKKSK